MSSLSHGASGGPRKTGSEIHSSSPFLLICWETAQCSRGWLWSQFDGTILMATHHKEGTAVELVSIRVYEEAYLGQRYAQPLNAYVETEVDFECLPLFLSTSSTSDFVVFCFFGFFFFDRVSQWAWRSQLCLYRLTSELMNLDMSVSVPQHLQEQTIMFCFNMDSENLNLWSCACIASTLFIKPCP